MAPPLIQAEAALTAVLTLAEGLAEQELLRSRLTRQAVRSHLLTAAAALAAVDPQTRDHTAELDFDGWAHDAATLADKGDPGQDAVLWTLVESRAPSTLSWLRVLRASAAAAS